MVGNVTRRSLLAGAGATLATVGLAEGAISLRPVARPMTRRANGPTLRSSAADVIAAAGMGGTVGFVVADLNTGAVIEAVDADVPLLPASVTKSITSLYALETLGPEHTFSTQIWADGPVADGVLDGNLILAGGGDPDLATDDLAELAGALRAAGVQRVTGQFEVWGGALPYRHEIDPAQLPYLGYNPAVSGLNLNYNRVHFEWARANGGYSVTMDARSELHRPTVDVAQMRIVDRASPVFTYADDHGIDRWTVARGALGNAGSRWLPVRSPDVYAGEVFRTFAASEGITLAAPVARHLPPVGQVVASRDSRPLNDILRDMLKYSTNLTAEITGLSATAARAGMPQPLFSSAEWMTRWVDARAGITARFADHSGLGDTTRIKAADMVRLLTADGVAAQLRPIMKPIPMVDAERNRLPDYPVKVRAKTGTLNFVSTLAGYMETASGRDVAFAIFGANLDLREAGKAAGDERPAGSASWNGRAKKLQQVLLQRYGVM